MPDMMAIVSKAVFEKAAGKTPTVGTVLGMDRYVSANKAFDKLASGGKLYLVTVRPPNEALWLVGILDKPKFDGDMWSSRASQIPITDISELKHDLVFENGKGIKAAKGQLGMTLQAPRTLTADDARLLDSAAGLAEDTADEAPAGPRARAGGGGGFPDAPEGAVETGAGNRRSLLLAAVVSDPDNEGARQVYADALVAANDPRGEFILVDMQLAGPLSIRKREQLSERRTVLLKQHEKAWFSVGVRYRIKRGFIGWVAGSLKKLTAAAPKLFANEPVTEVEVASLDGEEGVQRLLSASWLPRIQELVIRGKIKDAGFAALVASPAVANLRGLNVTGNKIGGDGLAALQGNLASCRKLVLTNNPLGAGVAGLATWAHAGQLEMLYLGNCKLTAAHVERMLDGPGFAKLTKLALTENELGNGIGKVLARNASKLPALEHLELHSTGIGTAGVKELAAGAWSAMRRFDVRNNRVDAKLSTEDPRISA